MDVQTRNELTGRLWLWANSVSKTQELLKTAFRADIGRKQHSQIEEMNSYIERLNEFVKQLPDYKPGTIYDSQQIAFDKIYPRPFATLMECYAVYDACVELSIIYFCHLFNSGYGETGSAASNDKKFRDEHLTKIIARVFKTNEELEKFNLLKDKIVTARNKMIGHADGDAYSIQHGEHVSTMKGPNFAWRDIDFVFWNSFLENMRLTIFYYSNEIKITESNKSFNPKLSNPHF